MDSNPLIYLQLTLFSHKRSRKWCSIFKVATKCRVVYTVRLTGYKTATVATPRQTFLAHIYLNSGLRCNYTSLWRLS